jgi:predicted transcriptional regulator
MGRRGKRLPEAARATQEAFEALGEDPLTASVLGALLGQKRQRIDAISQRSGYSLVPVRAALQRLEDRGWVWSERMPTGKRGQRPLVYTLADRRAVMLEYYLLQARRRIVQNLRAAQPW